MNMLESSKCLAYRSYKTELSIENYLTSNLLSECRFLVKLRTANHNFPNERELYQNIERYKRYCDVCVGTFLGDEYMRM